MATFLFVLLSLICLGSVVGMILARNPAYSALFLVLAFACLGGIFGLLDAPFIATVQVIIYAGAIMVLFIFVIMMIHMREGISPEKKAWTLVLAVVLAVVLALQILVALHGSGILGPGRKVTSFGHPRDIGKALFTEYLYPFEITSILILAALVGAIVLAKKRKEE